MSWTCNKCQMTNELNSVYCDNCGEPYHMPFNSSEEISEDKMDDKLPMHQDSILQKSMKVAVFVAIVLLTGFLVSSISKPNTQSKSNSAQSDAALSVNILNIIKSETGFLDFTVIQKENSMAVSILATSLASPESAKNISKQVLDEILRYYPNRNVNVVTKTFEGKILATVNN